MMNLVKKTLHSRAPTILKKAFLEIQNVSFRFLEVLKSFINWLKPTY